MQPVRTGDLIPVAKTLVGAFFPSGSGRLRRLGARLAVLWWAVWILLLPGFVHTNQKIVAQVTRNGLPGVRALLGRMVPAMAIGLIPVVGVATFIAARTSLLAGLVAALLPSLVFLLVGIVLAAAQRRDRRQLEEVYPPSTDAAVRKADAARSKEADVVVSTAASAGHGGLKMVEAHLKKHYAGKVVRADARTARHVRAYRSLGLVQLESKPWRLVGPVPRSGGQGRSSRDVVSVP